MAVESMVTIEGMQELEKALQKVGGSVAGVMKYAVSEASKPILEDGRSRIHSIDHDLEGSMGAALRNGKTGIWEGIRVGPQPPKGAHGHLVEFGHRMVTHDGRVVGNVPAHPFMRPAIRAQKGAAVARIDEILTAAIKEVVD